MITGETEALIENHLFDDEYDDFFGNKKKRQARRAARKSKRLARRLKRNSSAKVQERKQKRSKFFNDMGGATAIGGVIDAILMPKDRQAEPVPSDLPSDYQFSVGQSDMAIEEKNEKEQKKGIPIIVYVVGGVVVVGIIGLLVMQNKKASQVQTFSQ